MKFIHKNRHFLMMTVGCVANVVGGLCTYNHNKWRQLGLLPFASTLSGNAHPDASGHA
jgi:hypothetical protein